MVFSLTLHCQGKQNSVNLFSPTFQLRLLPLLLWNVSSWTHQFQIFLSGLAPLLAFWKGTLVWRRLQSAGAAGCGGGRKEEGGTCHHGVREEQDQGAGAGDWRGTCWRRRGPRCAACWGRDHWWPGWVGSVHHTYWLSGCENHRILSLKVDIMVWGLLWVCGVCGDCGLTTSLWHCGLREADTTSATTVPKLWYWRWVSRPGGLCSVE